MSNPIKGCPQPDAPELVMRADGYHYQEDEMSYRELTDKQVMAAAMDYQEANMSCYRAVIAADRALNAPADLEHQSVGKPVAWLLTDKNINDIQIGSVQRLIDRARQAHFTDLIIRINGKDEHYQADWLKHLVRAEVPVCAPADRDVTREAPNGWKLVPIEPTLDQYNSACRAYSDWQVQCQEEAREHEDERNPSWGYSQPHFTHSDVYRAMLAAVPTPPAEQRTEKSEANPPLPTDLLYAANKRAVPTARELDMAMAIRRIVSSARRNCEDGSNVLKLANEAWSYLVRQGLEGSPLRDTGIESDAPAESAPASEQPVAVIGKNWDIFWVGAQSIAEIARRNNLKVGMKLYTHPSPPLAALRAKVEALPSYATNYYGKQEAMLLRSQALAEIDKLGGGA